MLLRHPAARYVPRPTLSSPELEQVADLIRTVDAKFYQVRRDNMLLELRRH